MDPNGDGWVTVERKQKKSLYQQQPSNQQPSNQHTTHIIHKTQQLSISHQKSQVSVKTYSVETYAGPTLLSTSQYPKRNWADIYSRVKFCGITKQLGQGQYGIRGDYGRNLLRENDILAGMIDKLRYWDSGSFDVYTGIDFSLRYWFDVVSFDGKTLVADQYFLHYTGTNWMHCRKREVKIVLY